MHSPYHIIHAHIYQKLRHGLPQNLTYHSIYHVLDVLNQAERIAAEEKIKEEELFLLKVACLYHDSGFLFVYKDHEEKGCQIAQLDLASFDLNKKQIKQVCGMIMATKIPQSPQTKLEEIICDADLDYLGRDDFFPIATTLFHEMIAWGLIKTEMEWNRIQLKFLEQHHYFTSSNIRSRNEKKFQHLSAIKKIVDSYPE